MASSSAEPTLDEPGRTFESVVVHPLVLLSAVDHHYRIQKDVGKKRVVGVLLGETYKGRIDVTNSFAVPFEEDAKDPNIFFLDHDYLESLFFMFKKVSARERIVGFYSTSPKIRPADLALDALMRSLPFGTPHPVLVLVDVRPETEGLPVQSYQTVERVVDGKESQRTFVHIPCEVGAFEAEEVGVEHLLRDINDPSVSTTAAELRHQLNGLKGLRTHLNEAVSYLTAVVEGKMPANRSILYHLQSVLSSLPNSTAPALVKSLHESSNDGSLAVYIATLTRSVLALHETLNNKQAYAAREKELEEGTGDNKDKKDEKDKKAGEDGDKDGKAKDANKEKK